MSHTEVRRVAAAVLQRPDGRILLLKRSPNHTSNPGKWCFVTGYVEADESPREAAIRELREELGIQATPSRSGEVVVVRTDWGGTIHVYPFLFPVEDIDIRLDQEHVGFVWITPQELYEYDIVQQLDEDLIALGLL
ncbi:MAG TPA: NUDIX hydrolase [Chloroflexi bacterium]|nr:NUDIX hydrolase [Chloroflexota bacterium]